MAERGHSRVCCLSAARDRPPLYEEGPCVIHDGSVDAFPASAPFALAQKVFLDLARRRLRQVAELDRVGRFEMREALAAEADDLRFARRGLGTQRHERLRPFA